MLLSRLLPVLLLFLTPLLGQSLEGTYRLVKDSTGRTPKSGSVIELTFQPGTFKLKAVQPGETVEDHGTYRIRGQVITLSFQELDKGEQMGPFKVTDDTLVLPFTMLSDDLGRSFWKRFGKAGKESWGDLLARLLKESQEAGEASAQRRVDQLARGVQGALKGGLAEAYGAQGSLFFLKWYYHEAWYAWAKAAALQPQNGVYLNNLAMVLMELGRSGDAEAVLRQLTQWFPKLDSPWGNLAVLLLEGERWDEAAVAAKKAIALAPDTGLYHYTYAKILTGLGQSGRAKTHFAQAWNQGYAGSGREGAPSDGSDSSGGAGSASPSGGAKSGNQAQGRPRPNTGRGKGNAGQNPDAFPEAWVGHYEAEYVRARSGKDPKDAVTVFGKGLATTAMELRTLACAKSFSMDIDQDGRIRGEGQVMYVYQGKAVSPVMGLAPTMLTAGMGGFGVNLKGNFQILPWRFQGRAYPDGRVVIEGMPEGELDCLNVGKWQKLKPWSPLPPKGPGAAMKGPFYMTLATGKDSGPHIRVDQWLELGDKLIRRVHYQAFVVKTDNPITPDCVYEKPPEEKCPATESIKTKVAVSPSQYVTVETSTTYSRNSDGVQAQTEATTKLGSSSANLDATGKISIEGSKGLLTGSAEFAPSADGNHSYSFTVGVGVDTSSVLPSSFPFGISQKIELIYDSKCGWGVKGSFGAKAGGTSAGVEGVIFFNKGA